MPRSSIACGDHAGAGAQFQHRAGAGGIDLPGDGAGQRRAGRRHRADMFGTGDQGAQEAQIVGEGSLRSGFWRAWRPDRLGGLAAVPKLFQPGEEAFGLGLDAGLGSRLRIRAAIPSAACDSLTGVSTATSI